MSGRVAVIGTGSWGTTLAWLLAGKGSEVALCTRTEAEACALRSERENKVFLPGVRLPDNLDITNDLAQAVDDADLVLVAVPAATMRDNLQRLRDHLSPDAILVSATKGLEPGTALRMSEVMCRELPEESWCRIAVLSGPNLAREVAAGLPTAAVAAAEDEGVAQRVQVEVMTSRYLIYTNADIVGVEMGGALKNIIAITAGICDGMHYGDNAKSALMTRGLAEITRLGIAAGASPLTFAGLAGVGDLLATCASAYSRNHYVGEQLAKGRKVADIRASMKMVAEGVPTTAEACRLATRYGVRMPITTLLHTVLFEGRDLQDAIAELLNREARPELGGMQAPNLGQRNS